MEPVSWLNPSSSSELRFRAIWEHTEENLWETAELFSEADGRIIAGGTLGEAHRGLAAMVWSVACNEDWTVSRFRATPPETARWVPAKLDLRYDGDRRWWDEHDRELDLDTRDAPFVGWRGGACWHTPVLLHVGLDADESVDVEVLRLNISTGALRAVPHRYTPLGDGA